MTVQVEDDPHDLTKPRGKQDWQLEPHSIWYPRTTGIWQTVWLERVAATLYREDSLDAAGRGYALDFEARVLGDLLTTLTRRGRLAPRRATARAVTATRWSTAKSTGSSCCPTRASTIFATSCCGVRSGPPCSTPTVRLMRGEEVMDEFKSYTALRSVNILRDRFMLNGRPYMLRLVLDQGYWPDTLLAAPSDDCVAPRCGAGQGRWASMACASTRRSKTRATSTGPTSSDCWSGRKCRPRIASRARAIKRTVREWTEAIERDYSHPCVIVWVPFNESWGVPDLTAVSRATACG